MTAKPYRRGVGALIFNGCGLVLVARRIDTPFEAWQLPQGGIKTGERPKAAVLREVVEEVGTDNVEIVATSARWYRYDLPPDLAGRVWQGRYRGQEQRWFALRFLGSDADIDLAASGRPEFDAWRWVALDDIPHLAITFKRQLYADLAREFAGVAETVRTGGGRLP